MSINYSDLFTNALESRIRDLQNEELLFEGNQKEISNIKKRTNNATRVYNKMLRLKSQQKENFNREVGLLLNKV